MVAVAVRMETGVSVVRVMRLRPLSVRPRSEGAASPRDRDWGSRACPLRFDRADRQIGASLQRQRDTRAPSTTVFALYHG